MPEIKRCICFQKANYGTKKQKKNYTLALFKANSHRTALILNRLLKYNTLAQTVTYRDRHVPALKLYTIDQ